MPRPEIKAKIKARKDIINGRNDYYKTEQQSDIALILEALEDIMEYQEQHNTGVTLGPGNGSPR